MPAELDGDQHRDDGPLLETSSQLNLKREADPPRASTPRPFPTTVSVAQVVAEALLQKFATSKLLEHGVRDTSANPGSLCRQPHLGSELSASEPHLQVRFLR